MQQWMSVSEFESRCRQRLVLFNQMVLYDHKTQQMNNNSFLSIFEHRIMVKSKLLLMLNFTFIKKTNQCHSTDQF